MRVKREALSLNVLPEAKRALLDRADREGHRYPAVLAATLLERALGVGGQGGGGPTPAVSSPSAPTMLPNHKMSGGPGLADTLTYIHDEMVDIARQARAGELDVEYMYREIERWAAEIERVRG